MVWEIMLPFVMDVGKGVLTEIIKDYLLKNIPDINNKSQAEIPGIKVEEKIEKALQERHKEVRKILGDQYNDIEEIKELVWQIRSEIKTISSKNPDLEVRYDDRIRLSKEIQQETEGCNPENFKAQLLERLEESVAERLTELETRLSLQPNIGTDILQPKPFEQLENLPSSQTIKAPEVNNPQSKDKMSTYLENLSQYKEYGESILNELTSFNELSLPDEVRPQLSQCLQNLKESAKKTVDRATSPVQIAIMGEISSGKTLLVGSLIGYADALPVNEIATTGNVTAINLVQQEDGGTTKVDEFEVEYLSESGVKECLDFILKEAEQRAKAARLSSTQLESLNNLSRTNPLDWNGILQWCEQAWSNTNLELRYLIRELVLFARSYNAYGKDICGKTYKIDQTTAKEGLKLAEPQNISEISFSSLPPVPPRWKNLAQPSALELQKSFSLIRRIDITVKVSKQIWDLSSFKESNKFVLLDLPGLGSENSGVRDTFLSLSQIKEVQTFLLLLNGRSAAPGQAAAKIRTMIQEHKGEDIKDRIIVCVGRFNQIPLSAANKKALDDLIDDNKFFATT